MPSNPKPVVEGVVVRRWLDEIGQSRAWLANKCGVSTGTVNNWLSAGRPITGAAAIIISRLRQDKVSEQMRAKGNPNHD